MQSTHPVPIFVNPEAGHGGHHVPALENALAGAGVDAVVREVPPAELTQALHAAVRDRARIIGVGGGDGTLSTAATALLGSGAVLAPFPLGTLNHFARRLGIPDAAAAARALADGRTARVPMGSAGNRHFINNVACGFYPRVVRHRKRLRPWMGKWPAHAVAAAGVFLRSPRLRLTLEVGGSTLERRVPGLWLGLGRGSFTLPTEDSLRENADVLEVVIPHARSRAGLLALGMRVLWRLVRGRSPDTTGLEVVHATSIALDARRPIDAALDGEPHRFPPPLRLRILPRALEVIVGEAGE